MNVYCMFVCTLYKSTFLNRSEPNFAHISPVVWKRSYGMYGPTIFHLSHLFDLFCRERVQIPAQWMAAGATVPLLRYIRDAARAGVTSRTAVGCATKTRRSEWNARV